MYNWKFTEENNCTESNETLNCSYVASSFLTTSGVADGVANLTMFTSDDTNKSLDDYDMDWGYVDEILDMFNMSMASVEMEM